MSSLAITGGDTGTSSRSGNIELDYLCVNTIRTLAVAGHLLHVRGCRSIWSRLTGQNEAADQDSGTDREAHQPFSQVSNIF